MSADKSEHVWFMRRALELARGVWGTTHPNPMVGAVIVENGEIVAEGATAPDGGPHAEKAALAALGRAPRPGATLYATLEPCCTEGRTGACTDSILAALRKDKKFHAGAIRFVLLRNLGDAFVSDSVTAVDIEQAIEALR